MTTTPTARVHFTGELCQLESCDLWHRPAPSIAEAIEELRAELAMSRQLEDEHRRTWVRSIAAGDGTERSQYSSLQFSAGRNSGLARALALLEGAGA